ncbi:MAG: Gar1/Naf1 family protein [Thermoplasmata archaeon]|nr:Gar1/Naf1 family protein [Thermoplasmata archaeon]
MKKLGTVKNVIHDGTILLNTSGTTVQEIPAPGARVYDSRGMEIGRVARVFGPVKEPYIALKPISDIETFELLGASMYLGTEEQRNEDRQRAVRRSSNQRTGYGARQRTGHGPRQKTGYGSRPTTGRNPRPETGQRSRPETGRSPSPRRGEEKSRSTGPAKKKGVNKWQRKEKPRKR